MHIVSYNIQATINSRNYLAYSYEWPRQFLPLPSKKKTREQIAAYLNRFDVACLQEIDLGGLRNAFQNHAEQFDALTDFKYYTTQTNRRISKLSLHGNMILSKKPFEVVLDCALPGKVSGRGVLAVLVEDLVIANVHLSLGTADQQHQLHFINEQLRSYEQVILCGDFNCTPQSAPLKAMQARGWRLLGNGSATFPAWQPKKALDHALYKGTLNASSHVSRFNQSDHLPIIITIN
ncbi:endonuclease/exonuclease/phosphatase family protein [Suttonella sp. R2A3]|uniref:endonuclease/exonuclease/phosphatase family protein n=1 Tax=Suttonella sp. R2A3 TaxID=2908648 RepID=UPI001F2B3A9D|nr:endonuclease/exonuclease/phosphatase family protein [Suttonella sp. R2A3]UJF24533.1 endonuclease/exonuclease/phosphatase family protein [Suttonella sp. R2A3]